MRKLRISRRFARPKPKGCPRPVRPARPGSPRGAHPRQGKRSEPRGRRPPSNRTVSGSRRAQAEARSPWPARLVPVPVSVSSCLGFSLPMGQAIDETGVSGAASYPNPGSIAGSFKRAGFPAFRILRGSKDTRRGGYVKAQMTPASADGAAGCGLPLNPLQQSA